MLHTSLEWLSCCTGKQCKTPSCVILSDCCCCILFKTHTQTHTKSREARLLSELHVTGLSHAFACAQCSSGGAATRHCAWKLIYPSPHVIFFYFESGASAFWWHVEAHLVIWSRGMHRNLSALLVLSDWHVREPEPALIFQGVPFEGCDHWGRKVSPFLFVVHTFGPFSGWGFSTVNAWYVYGHS